jgi:hypothetical protein
MNPADEVSAGVIPLHSDIVLIAGYCTDISINMLQKSEFLFQICMEMLVASAKTCQSKIVSMSSLDMHVLRAL